MPSFLRLLPLYVLLLIGLSLAAIEENLASSKASLDGLDTSLFIYGSVNALTGALVHSATDLSVAGSTPLTLSRSFCSRNALSHFFGKGFSDNFCSSVPYKGKKGKHYYFYLQEQGSFIEYSVKALAEDDLFYREYKFCLSHTLFDQGLTNTGSGLLSGKTNLKNDIMIKEESSRHDKKHKEIRLTLHKNSGVIREYRGEDSLLTKEIKTNNDCVLFEYHRNSFTPRLIATVPPSERPHLTSLTFHKGDNTLCVKASNGKRADYALFEATVVQKFNKLGKITLLGWTDATDSIPTNYGYSFHQIVKGAAQEVRIKDITHPDGRYTAFDYSENDGHKVSKIKAPAGPQGQEKVLYQLNYFGGHTTVRDGRSLVRKYYSTDKKCPSKITESINNTLYRATTLFWTEGYRLGDREKKRPLIHELKKKQFEDGENNVLYEKDFVYDGSGGCVRKTLWGNLTGTDEWPYLKQVEKRSMKKDKVEIRRMKDVQNESYSTCASYEPKKPYRLFGEKEEGGLSTIYSYLNDTELLKKKRIVDEEIGEELFRHTYHWNNLNMLTREEVVGGGVHRVRTIQPMTTPCTSGFSLPVEEVESVIDQETGIAHQLRRVCTTYGLYDLPVKHEVYDALDQFAYAVEMVYDDHGNLTETIDPMGRKTLTRYDGNRNKVCQELVGSNAYTLFFYDRQNRLTRKETHHSDGSVEKEERSYDVMGGCTAVTDEYGQTTHFTLDTLGRTVKTTSPSLKGIDGESIPVEEQATFDIADRVIRRKRVDGEETLIAYTVRGDPLKVTFPDGTYERSIYTTSGLLSSKRERNGITLRTDYDRLKRPVKVETYDREGQLVRTVTHHYNALHLIAREESNGTKTTFTYDCAGRPIKELKTTVDGSLLTEYGYDAMGRQNLVRKWLDDLSYRDQITLYDALNRPIERRVESQEGTIHEKERTVYDLFGNISEIHHYISEENVAVTTRRYSSRGELIEEVDPEGNTTTISYERGERCVKTTLDPLGMKTVETFNAFHQLESVQKFESSGTLLAETAYFYDTYGHKIAEQHARIREGRREGSYTLKWRYDAMGHLLEESEEGRCTQHAYNSFGDKILTIKPDGTRITMTYDSMGRLQRLESSDDSIAYLYHYDSNDNLIEVEEVKTGKRNERHFNALQQLTREKLFTGLTMKYAYDLSGRLKEATLPDGSSFRLDYDATLLLGASRFDAKKKLLYSHKWLASDWAGNTLKAQLITGREATYSFDKLLRLRTIKTPWYKAEAVLFDPVGNPLHAAYEDSAGAFETHFSYDSLYQLKSEEGEWKNQFRHDSLYNCTEENGKILSVNQFNEVVDASLAYDGNGHLIQDGETTYTYDALGRMTGAKKRETYSILFSYDSFGRRLERTKAEWNPSVGDFLENEKTLFLYQGDKEIGAIREGKLTEFRLLGKGRGQEIGGVVAIELDGIPYQPLHDLRGNPVALIDLGGNVVETARFSAFGEVTRRGVGLSPWSFLSKRLDPDTGLLSVGHRDYHIGLHRFTTQDPARFTDGPNLYAYVKNRPLLFYDLYGLRAQSYNPYANSMAPPSLFQPFIRIGRGVEMIGSHFPDPADYAIEGIGRLLQGESFIHKKRFSTPYECSYLPGDVDRHIPTLGNGILTCGINEMIPAAERLQQECGGLQTYIITSPTRGFSNDLINSTAELLGIPTVASRFKAEVEQRLYGERKLLFPDPILHSVNHSRGCLIDHRSNQYLSPEVLANKHVYSMASPDFYGRGQVASCRHYTNDFDLVASFCNPSYSLSRLAGAELEQYRHVINGGLPSYNPLTNHLLVSYDWALNRIGRIIRGQREAQTP